ncbi:MAG: AMP-binding protein, partial [Thiobacillus sp.]
MTNFTPADATQLLDLVRGLTRELRPGAHGIDRLGLDHELERDFGLDSLARVELLARIERELGVRLAEAAFAEAETPRDLLRQMAEAGPAEATAPTPAAMEEDAPKQAPQTLATLIELLDWHVAQHGERVHITLEDGAGQSEDISYRALQAGALALVAGLVEHGLPLAEASGMDGGRPAPGPNAGGGAAPEIAARTPLLQLGEVNHAGDCVAPDSITGERVAIMLPTGHEFFAAFYGALYAGCVPVPLYPPARPSQIEEHMRRIAGIVANAGAALLITDARAKPLGHLLRAQCP